MTGWKSAIELNALAAVYAETGQIDEAIRWQKGALESEGWPTGGREEARKALKLHEEKKREGKE